MEYSNNCYKLDEHQNEKIREIKSKHTILSDYLTEVLNYMRTQGIDIVLDRIPSQFDPDGEKGIGWYGPIEGSIKNNNNEHKIYASTIWNGSFNSFTTNEPILNLINAGGNGGPRFNYFQGTFISIDTLPKLKHIPYDKDKAYREGEALNTLINPTYSKYYRVVSDKSDELRKHKKYKQIIKICDLYEKTGNGLYWIKSKAEKILRVANSYYNAEAEREFYYELPPITGVYTDTKNYYSKQLEIRRNLHRFTEPPQYDIVIDEYNLYLEKNPEVFI